MVPPRLRRSMWAIAAAPPSSCGVGVLPGAGDGGHGQVGAVVVAVAATDEAPGAEDDRGLFGGPAAPGVQRLGPTQPSADGVRDPCTAQGGEGGRVAAAPGRPVAPEPKGGGPL